MTDAGDSLERVIACPTCSGSSPLCDRCLAAAEEKVRGVAAMRGTLWADRTAEHMRTRRAPGSRSRAPATRRWPAYEGRARELARAKVADIAAGDERLLELLARRCHAEAARRWASAAAHPTRGRAR